MIRHQVEALHSDEIKTVDEANAPPVIDWLLPRRSRRALILLFLLVSVTDRSLVCVCGRKAWFV